MMRIAQLKYTRFGHFTDFRLDLPTGADSDFHIILGANEAGKSTMVEGWMNLLYGIPNRTSYAFRHDRDTLEISAVIEEAGQSLGLTRLPTRRNNLVGADGAAVPEATLGGLLRGVTEDVYKHLYCLNDETIEQGGDDILASKGDLGQLLFAAASGMATFNETLERIRDEDRAFHVAKGPGRHSSTLATLRKDLGEIDARIKQVDLTAPDYRRLKDVAEQAAAAEILAKEEHAALVARDQALRAKLVALPIKAELADLEAALRDLGAQPDLPDGTAAEMAELSTRREAHLATLRARRADIVTWAAERDNLVLDPRAEGLADALAGIDLLREDAGSSARDLPRRREERDDILRKAAPMLADLGLGGADPATVPVSGAVIDRLDQAAQALETAEAAVLTAAKERDRAAESLEKARGTMPSPGGADVDSETLAELLLNLAAEAKAVALTEARARRADAVETLGQALSGLTIGGRSFSTAGPVPLTVEGAEALAAELTALAGKVQALDDSVAEVDRQHAGLGAEIAALLGQGTAPDDSTASELRARRDRLWSDHRTALTPETADSFAEAMAADDEAGALRLADTGRLADLRRAERDHARTAAERETLDGQRAAAASELAALKEKLTTILEAIGLPSGLSAGELATWLAAHEHACSCQMDLEDAERRLAETEAAAAPVAIAIAEQFPTTKTDLPDLLIAAQEHIQQARSQQGAARLAMQQLAEAEEALAQRGADLAAAEGAFDTAMGTLSEALSGLGFTLPEALEPKDAVPRLRALMAEQAKLGTVNDRIAKMEANVAAFAERISAVAAPWPELADKPSAEQAAALDRIAEDHRRQSERHADLGLEITRAEALVETVDRELAEIHDRAAEIARAWPGDDRPEAFADILSAVNRADQWADLQGRKASLARRLIGTLEVDSLATALSQMNGLTETGLRTEQQVLAPDLSEAAEARDTAIRDRGLADRELRAVSGEGDVASLMQERHVLLEQVRAETARGLRRRIGLKLAERALARYRDQHRGAMLAETESAFLELTGGDYSGLAAQQDGANEFLIANRARDGRSLRVGEETMSKGTRFQLYLALRLAGYRQMADAGTVLPFLCDDIFETFDEPRTAAACRLMHRVGQIGQALYFTHHAHVAEIARAECPGVQVHLI